MLFVHVLNDDGRVCARLREAPVAPGPGWSSMTEFGMTSDNGDKFNGTSSAGLGPDYTLCECDLEIGRAHV